MSEQLPTEQPTGHTKAARDELMQLLRGLHEFRQQAEQQYLNQAMLDNPLPLHETKGMLRASRLILAQVAARMQELSKLIPNDGEGA